MKAAMIGSFIAIALSVSIAHARETATYVGEGRYVGQDWTSSDSAILRQRNQEQAERVRERDRSEQRYEQSERRERAYEYESSDRYDRY
ncbi:MAG: hypothetical protein ACREUR_07970 [Nitrosospira sp.]